MMGLASKKVYSEKKVPAGYRVSDPARSREQAFSLARSFPPDMPAVVVKTGGVVFPYHVYVRELFGDSAATAKEKKRLN